MILILFGPPGSGKGSQAQYLVENYSFEHISTGNILRDEIISGSVFGQEIKEIVDSGNFISDDIIMKLVEQKLDDNAHKNIIFDGFPRTLNQVLAFDGLLSVRKIQVDLVLNFNVDLAQLEERVIGRFTCSNCSDVYHDKFKKPIRDGICDTCGSESFVKREDDNSDVLKRRIAVYLEETEVLKNFYFNKGVLENIDASQEINQVKDSVTKCLLKTKFI